MPLIGRSGACTRGRVENIFPVALSRTAVAGIEDAKVSKYAAVAKPRRPAARRAGGSRKRHRALPQITEQLTTPTSTQPAA